MTKGIVYGVLVVCSLAMLMFLAGFICWQLGLSWLTSLSYVVAGNLMLLAFGALLLLGSWLLLLAACREVAGYFRREHRALRKLLMLQGYHQHARQLGAQQKRQLFYWSQFKRQNLLVANDKKHSRMLFKAINAELKNKLEPEVYKSLHQDLKRLNKQSNPQAMLALRDQALCQTSVIG